MLSRLWLFTKLYADIGDAAMVELVTTIVHVPNLLGSYLTYMETAHDLLASTEGEGSSFLGFNLVCLCGLILAL